MLQAAMLGVTSNPSGTAFVRFKGFPIRVAGKTGSAEVEGQSKPDAWFTCYAPASPVSGPAVTPQLAMAVAVPNSGFGEPIAVPITIDILKQFPFASP